METPAFRFSVNEKHFENGDFQKRWCHDKHHFSARVFLEHKSKVTFDCSAFKFVQRSVDDKHWMRFQSENGVFKFLRSNASRGSKLFRPRQPFFRHEINALLKLLIIKCRAGKVEELWKPKMVYFLINYLPRLSGYILVYKNEQESDNLFPRVRLRIRTYDVLVSFLRAYRD